MKFMATFLRTTKVPVVYVHAMSTIRKCANQDTVPSKTSSRTASNRCTIFIVGAKLVAVSTYS